MKHLIAVILALSGMTSIMLLTENEVDKLTPDDARVEIAQELRETYPDMVVVEDTFYISSASSSEEIPLEEIDAALDAVKDKAWARIKHLQEVKDITNRLKALKSLRMSMHKCGYKIPNAMLFRRKIIKNKDYTKLECLESKNIAIIGEFNAEITLKSTKKAARLRLKAKNCANITETLLRDICWVMK